MTQMPRETLTVGRENAILAAVLLPGHESDPHDPLGELRSLADTAGAVVVDELMQRRQKPVAPTFIGKGKVQELAEMVKALDVSVVIFDNDLSPSQIGNIEQVVECKVLDRSELILDIFAGRAKTYEAKLQVELAQLQYTYPRLTAMWSHLERIVGGAPTGIGTRGPGEQQLEIDRRMVQRRKTELRREIKQLQQRKTREVERRKRDFLTVSLVGYTNAGKSTLFNTATIDSGGGGAYADDKLFATLSTRTRRWDLGGGVHVMLSDTVGFVRDLPHHLVASFRATLEEAVHSDLLLVILDVAHPRAKQQLQTVMQVLDEIGATDQQRLLMLNKADLLEHNADILAFRQDYADCLAISAKTGDGLDELLEQVRMIATGASRELVIELDLSQGKAISFIESQTEIIDREYAPNKVSYTARLGSRQLAQLKALGISEDRIVKVST